MRSEQCRETGAGQEHHESHKVSHVYMRLWLWVVASRVFLSRQDPVESRRTQNRRGLASAVRGVCLYYMMMSHVRRRISKRQKPKSGHLSSFRLAIDVEPPFMSQTTIAPDVQQKSGAGRTGQ
jgi:hypothetical protein